MSTAASRNLDLETAQGEAQREFIAANPKSAEQYEIACRSLPGGNLRSHMFHAPFPLTMTHGEGVYLWDLDGHRYVDYLSEFGAGLFGHTDPSIAAALKEAIDSGIVMGAPGELEAKFGAVLCERFPSIERVRFGNSGTEANLFAFAAARAHTDREKIMVFNGAYHGSSFNFAKGASPLNAPFDYVVARYNDTEGTLALIEENADDLAAVVVEPMQGAGGSIPAEREFLEALREATRKHGIVFIFDEVITSRMSPGGLQEVLGIMPDMTTLGKYVGGGSSFGAFGGSLEIMRRFDPREPDAYYHAGTFNNDRMTMAAGYTAMAEVYTPEVVSAFNERGERLRGRIAETIDKHGAPLQVTGIGAVMALHFTDRPLRSVEDVEHGNALARSLWHFDMLAHGQYVASRGGLMLSLPLGDAEFDGFVVAIDDFLALRGPLLAWDS